MSCKGCGKRIAAGVSGLTKAITGGDPVERETRLGRSRVCDECEQKRGPMCNKCGCVIAAKIRVAGEACPLGKWPAEERRRGEA